MNNSSKIFLSRILNLANMMNSAIKSGNKADYEYNEKMLDFTVELATDIGHEVHVYWRPDGQIASIQVAKQKAQAIFYEE